MPVFRRPHASAAQILVIGGLVGFALCPAPVRAAELRGVPALPTRTHDVGAVLDVEPAGPLTARLAIRESAQGQRIRAYDVDMTKRMHVIIVGDDLGTFLHVHPVLDDSGTFRVAVTVPQPGLYHVYADGDPHGYGHRVFRFDVRFGAAAMKRDLRDLRGVRTARAGPYAVTLDRTSVPAGTPAAIAVTVTKNGRLATDLHPYLGGLAHAVFVNASDLSYLHVHPMPPGTMNAMPGMSGMDAGQPDGATGDAMPMQALPDDAQSAPRMHLAASLPSAGTYVLWFQFRGARRIYVARFVITALARRTPVAVVPQ
jgi:hypothetical protein